jgi:hypothetical protein
MRFPVAKVGDPEKFEQVVNFLPVRRGEKGIFIEAQMGEKDIFLKDIT